MLRRDHLAFMLSSPTPQRVVPRWYSCIILFLILCPCSEGWLGLCPATTCRVWQRISTVHRNKKITLPEAYYDKPTPLRALGCITDSAPIRMDKTYPSMDYHHFMQNVVKPTHNAKKNPVCWTERNQKYCGFWLMSFSKETFHFRIWRIYK